MKNGILGNWESGHSDIPISQLEVDGPALRSEGFGKILGHAPVQNPPSARELSTAPCG